MAGFRKAERKQLKLRMAIAGPAKSGKSITALRFAFALGQKVAVIEAGEWGATEKYQGEEWDGHIFDFDIKQLRSFSPEEYTESIEEAGRLNFDVLIIDSLSHEWMGTGGTLEIADNKFQGWKTASPLHNRMFEAMLNSPCHVIATMRSKMDYVVEINDKGKHEPRRIGMQPIQRPGAEYEFDIICELDQAHILTVTGSRCRAVEGATVLKPGAKFMAPIIEWLNHGTRVTVAPPSPLISDEQTAQIVELLRRLNWTMERLTRGFPEKYQCTELRRLTREQADDVIRWLEAQARAAGRKANRAAPPPPAAESGSASVPPKKETEPQQNGAGPQASTPSPGKSSATNAKQTSPAPPRPAELTEIGGPVTRDQLDLMRKLQADLVAHGMKPDEWKTTWLAKYGVETALRLTNAQASTLLSDIVHHLNELDRKTKGGETNGAAVTEGPKVNFP